MAKKTEKTLTPAEQLKLIQSGGVEQTMPGTGRVVKLRNLNAKDLLQDAKLPDILTPLVVKSVYQDTTDREIRELLGNQRSGTDDALKMLDTIDYVVGKAIADGTKVDDLTLAEKRWIFRLALGPAELLITFRLDEESDVEPVAEGDKVQPTAE